MGSEELRFLVKSYFRLQERFVFSKPIGDTVLIADSMTLEWAKVSEHVEEILTKSEDLIPMLKELINAAPNAEQMRCVAAGPVESFFQRPDVNLFAREVNAFIRSSERMREALRFIWNVPESIEI